MLIGNFIQDPVLILGASIQTGEYYSGGIDELKLFSRILTLDKIQTLYELGR